MSNSIKKVVLAYSGGLDTSAIVPWLIETYGCEVVCACADVGQEDDHDGLEERAKAAGASKLYIADLTDKLCEDFIWPMIKSGTVYEKNYLLGTAIARPIVAKWLVEIAELENCDAIAHGCTGKGNDQVRFENTIQALNPDLKVIAPWRFWNFTSREDLIAYIGSKNLPYPDSVHNPKLFSRDRNIWHISHEGGPIEDINSEPDEDWYVLTVSPENAPDKPEYVEIEFVKGEAVALNGTKMKPADLLRALNEIGGRNGIGRSNIVENRLVGMKSHGLYENPGGAILYEAHTQLESITLDRDTEHFKETIAVRYAELIYNGLWYSPLCESLNAFFAEANKNVTGTVKLKLYKGNIIPVGISSPCSLYSEKIASFGDVTLYDHKDATGFIRCFTLPSRVRSTMEKNLKG